MKQCACMIALLAVLCVPATATVSWAASAAPLPEALAALQSDDAVTVTRRWVWLWRDFYYAFEPANQPVATGFIFYPGGAVDPRSYAPFARAIAREGYRVIIVSMPLDLAIFGWKRAIWTAGLNRDIDTWVIGGHSFGGSMACRFAQQYPERIAGVCLWASYPSESFRIDDQDLAVTSIYGSLDGLVSLAEIDENRAYLPADTVYRKIKGANHTQFGWYDPGTADGLQEGDNPARISREQQQQQVVAATVEFLARQ